MGAASATGTTLGAMALGHFPGLGEDGVRRVCRDALAYLLKTAEDGRSRQASTDLARSLREVAGGSGERGFRKELYEDGYLLKNVKLWLWWTASKRLKARESRRAMPDFKVRPEDWPLAGVAFNDGRIRRRLAEMSSKYEAHTLEGFDAFVERALAAADKAVRGYAYRKLRFLEMTRFITSDDLLAELRCHAILSLTRQYPKLESDEHARNTVSLCITQGGTSLIGENTRKGKEFMIRNADGTWDGLVLSSDRHDSGSVPGYDPLGVAPDVDVQDGLAALGSEFVASGYKGRRREFATIMLGIENRGFSKRLGEYGLPPNHILFDEAAAGSPDLFERYVKHAAGWVGVSEKAAWRFLREEMGSRLGG